MGETEVAYFKGRCEEITTRVLYNIG